MAPTNEPIEVVCTHCCVPMTAYLGSGGCVRYYRCTSCMRWASSTYSEVFRADAKFRARSSHRPPQPPPEVEVETPRASYVPPNSPPTFPPSFEDVKGKLERWLASVDDRDPYRALGVSPLDTDEQVRLRFRELAMEYHPDRGGAPEKMRDLNLAYERILHHRAARRAEREASVGVGALPARAR